MSARPSDSSADLVVGNVGSLFLRAIDLYDKPDAIKYKRSGAWYSISHSRLYEDVKRLGLALGLLNIRKGDRVALLSENRPEWLISDFACALHGVISVPLYPNLPANQIEHMLRHCEAAAILLSGEEQLTKLQRVRSRLGDLKHVIAFDSSDEAGAREADRGVTTLRRLLDLAGPELSRYPDPEYRERAEAIDPHELLTIVYTSGTTGPPKGVMLTHNNLVSNVHSVQKILDLRPSDVSLSHLPLSHIFERMAGQFALFSAGATICYAESIQAVAENMREVRPTVLVSVPRAFEKMHESLVETARQSGAPKRSLIEWAVRVGEAWAERKLAGQGVGPGLAVKRRIADRLVFSKLRASMGGRIRFLVSGGAPLSRRIAALFYAARLPILEGYGMTETSPVISVNHLGSVRLGSVGQPIPGVEVKIAEDGEILTRGPHTMRGYYRDPEATTETLSADGWLRTGDLGELDADGFLSVIDRKKDLIKTSGGKYIAPQPIENRVISNPYVSQAVVVGERRKFPALLIVPDFEVLGHWARERGLEYGDPSELTSDPRVIDHLEREILTPLQDLARFERPKKIALLPHPLTVEGGELTPTLKVKRKEVDRKFGELIDSLYIAG